MNWKLINKRNQPKAGVYSDWKEQIAEECFNQCVYCSIHEAQFGGIDHYHIDHFRPKSIFGKLENDIYNLFYACPICNRFKSDDWPGNPDLTKVSYPDPSKTDYSQLFALKSDFEIKGKYIASEYLVLRLFLNRAQLIMERREAIRRSQVNELIKAVSSLMEEAASEDSKFALKTYKEIDAIKNNLLQLEESRRKIRPYKLKDIRKP